MSDNVSESTTLADALPREIERVRDELMPQYKAIGNPGILAYTMMQLSVKAAERAIAAGDVVAMLRAYQDLKGFVS